jgi:hypothetical protein
MLFAAPLWRGFLLTLTQGLLPYPHLTDAPDAGGCHMQTRWTNLAPMAGNWLPMSQGLLLSFIWLAPAWLARPQTRRRRPPTYEGCGLKHAVLGSAPLCCSSIPVRRHPRTVALIFLDSFKYQAHNAFDRAAIAKRPGRSQLLLFRLTGHPIQGEPFVVPTCCQAEGTCHEHC